MGWPEGRDFRYQKVIDGPKLMRVLVRCSAQWHVFCFGRFDMDRAEGSVDAEPFAESLGFLVRTRVGVLAAVVQP